MTHVPLRLWLVALLVLLPSGTAAAQAWVSPEGELSLSLRSDYQRSDGVWHGATLVTGLPVQAFSHALSVEYVPIEQLAVGLTLNGNGVRYTGPRTQPGNMSLLLAHGAQDDGAFHWSLTDLELETRFQAHDGAVALTPLVRVRVPVTDYERRGYAAAGGHLREGSAGLLVGRYGLGLADLVFQVGYTFTYVEKSSDGGTATERYRVNRSDLDLSLSYVIHDRLIAGAGAALRYTHDGFDLTRYPDLAPGDPLIQWHDPVLRARYVAPTVVASYQLSPTWSVSGRVAAAVWGQNVSNPISFGLTVGWASNLAE